jgi:hypothetical protein
VFDRETTGPSSKISIQIQLLRVRRDYWAQRPETPETRSVTSLPPAPSNPSSLFSHPAAGKFISRRRHLEPESGTSSHRLPAKARTVLPAQELPPPEKQAQNRPMRRIKRILMQGLQLNMHIIYMLPSIFIWSDSKACPRAVSAVRPVRRRDFAGNDAHAKCKVDKPHGPPLERVV